MPRLYLLALNVGDIGRLSGNFEVANDKYQVLQILDETNMLIQGQKTGIAQIASETEDSVRRIQKVAWISGVDTSGVVDDSYVTLNQIMEAVGTKQYQTALGSKTVFELSPFPIQDVGFLKAKLAKAKTEESTNASDANSTANELRKWTDATGEHTVLAEFAGMTAGKVNLKKSDGTMLTVPLDKLSNADQEWIKNRR